MRIWLNRTVEGSDFANQRNMISKQQRDEQRAAIQLAADRAAAVAEGIRQDEYMRSPEYARDRAKLAEIRRKDEEEWAKINRFRPLREFVDDPLGYLDDHIGQHILPGYMHAL